MIGRIWSLITTGLRRDPQHPPRPRVVMTAQCRDLMVSSLRRSSDRGHEGVVYFVGLTTGTTTLAVSAVFPDAVTTRGSFDVGAPELGKIIRTASMAGLQVVGQLHTHPRQASHSQGDIEGMRIRYPGYFSIVVPDYGALLPSFEQSHTLMWTTIGFQEIDESISVFQEGAP